MKDEFFNIAKDILLNDEYLSLNGIRHHRTTRYKHSIRVAYVSFITAKLLKLNTVEIVRGALLHDMFYQEKQIKMFNKHPMVALKNAKEHFKLSILEEDIIVKHMFPATISLPKYRESWLVCIIDTLVAIPEFCINTDKLCNFDKYLIMDSYIICNKKVEK